MHYGICANGILLLLPSPSVIGSPLTALSVSVPRNLSHTCIHVTMSFLCPPLSSSSSHAFLLLPPGAFPLLCLVGAASSLLRCCCWRSRMCASTARVRGGILRGQGPTALGNTPRWFSRPFWRRRWENQNLQFQIGNPKGSSITYGTEVSVFQMRAKVHLKLYSCSLVLVKIN